MALKEWIDLLSSSPERAPDVELLRGALRLATEGAKQEDFDRARRELVFPPDAIRKLSEDSLQLEHGGEFVAVHLMLLATSMASGDALLRAQVASRLGDVAMQVGIQDIARTALVDALESLAVLGKFFEGDGEQLKQWTGALEAQLETLRAESPDGTPRYAADYPNPDPLQEWGNAVLWNLDFGPGAKDTPGNGDAIVRLARRITSFGDAEPQQLAHAVRELARRAATLPEQPGALRTRFLMTVTGALYEAEEWLLGARVCREAPMVLQAPANEPRVVHFAVQEAFGLLMAGDDETAHERWQAIDGAAIEAAANHSPAFAADAARYVAVENALRRKRQEPADETRVALVRDLAGRVSSIAKPEPDRASYLSNLFVGMLFRDLAALEEMA